MAVYVQKPDGSVTSVSDTFAVPSDWTVITEAAAAAINPALTGASADPAVTAVQMNDGFGNPVNYTVTGQPILTTNAASLQHTIPDTPSTGTPSGN